MQQTFLDRLLVIAVSLTHDMSLLNAPFILTLDTCPQSWLCEDKCYKCGLEGYWARECKGQMELQSRNHLYGETCYIKASHSCHQTHFIASMSDHANDQCLHNALPSQQVRCCLCSLVSRHHISMSHLTSICCKEARHFWNGTKAVLQ